MNVWTAIRIISNDKPSPSSSRITISNPSSPHLSRSYTSGDARKPRSEDKKQSKRDLFSKPISSFSDINKLYTKKIALNKEFFPKKENNQALGVLENDGYSLLYDGDEDEIDRCSLDRFQAPSLSAINSWQSDDTPRFIAKSSSYSNKVSPVHSLHKQNSFFSSNPAPETAKNPSSLTQALNYYRRRRGNSVGSDTSASSPTTAQSSKLPSMSNLTDIAMQREHSVSETPLFETTTKRRSVQVLPQRDIVIRRSSSERTLSENKVDDIILPVRGITIPGDHSSVGSVPGGSVVIQSSKYDGQEVMKGRPKSTTNLRADDYSRPPSARPSCDTTDDSVSVSIGQAGSLPYHEDVYANAPIIRMTAENPPPDTGTTTPERQRDYHMKKFHDENCNITVK